jgi:hypothetical protein
MGKFHGIFHGISWKNFMKKYPSNVYEKVHEFHGKFRGIPWNSVKFSMGSHGIAWNLPWNSMEFHETEVDGIP